MKEARRKLTYSRKKKATTIKIPPKSQTSSCEILKTHCTIEKELMKFRLNAGHCTEESYPQIKKVRLGRTALKGLKSVKINPTMASGR